MFKMSIIVMWNGRKEDIPKGWQMCDGTNGTFNLKDKFVKMANQDIELGQYGGSETHEHIMEETSVSHSHSSSSEGTHNHLLSSTNYTGGRKLGTVDSSHSHSVGSTNARHTHNIGGGSSIPEHYSLIYIQEKNDTNINKLLKKDMIALWGGFINEIPDDWTLCNGEHNTPDLRNLYIRCINTLAEVGERVEKAHSHQAASSGSHTHSSESTNFSHNAQDAHRRVRNGNSVSEYLLNTYINSVTVRGGNHSHTLSSSGSHSHNIFEEEINPPYCKLFYIKKIA